MEGSFVVSLARFHRRDPHIYVVQGYFQDNSIAGSRMSAQFDGKDIPVTVSVREGLAIRQKYFSRGIGFENIDREYDLWMALPEGYEKGRMLRLYQQRDGKRRCVFKVSVRRLLKEQKMPDGFLETFRDDGENVSIGGWAVGNSQCRLQVLDRAGVKLRTDVTWHYRQDIADNYPELRDREPEMAGLGTEEGNAPAAGEEGNGQVQTRVVDLSAVRDNQTEQEALRSLSFGYEVRFHRPASSHVRLIVAADGQKMTYHVNLKKGIKGLNGSGSSAIRKGIVYFRRNGFLRTAQRIREKISEKLTGRTESYMNWRKHTLPTREELEAQSRNKFLREPLISIVVPLYRTPEVYLRQLIDSVRAQTYASWELCLSDGSGPDSPLKKVLENWTGVDPRIRVEDARMQLGISENTNRALFMARGDYIVFADHDDTLPPFALYECVKMINEHPDADLIYSDEDKLSMNGKEYFQPHFKSDFNIDLLCSMNYFCHLVMVSRDLYEKVGGLDDAYDGAQDYDFVLRCVERARKICHIPMVLYHWRSHKDSTAENPKSKRYAFEAGMRAVQAHYDRIGVDAKVIMGEYPGLYQTVYAIKKPEPMISIIIPNKDHIADLDKCVRSILERSTYSNYEFLVVENNSTLDETFEYYRQMEAEHANFRVLYWKEGFNFSAINNFGAEYAKGEYLLFLNNDTQIICNDCLEQLLGPCQRPEVGAVGARLFYEDGTIQHAGVIIGYGGIAGHAFLGFDGNANGYFSRIICQSDLSAVTAACMMVRKDVFLEAGGFDEKLEVAFNDIDFCLKLRSMGKLVVYNPFAALYHFESKSRGMEDTPGKIARFNKEADELLKRWPDIVKNGDPYYNPNLSLDRSDFALKKY